MHSRQHSPTGRIGAGRRPGTLNGNPADVAATFSLTGQNFNYAGTAIQPFQNGNVIGVDGGEDIAG